MFAAIAVFPSVLGIYDGNLGDTGRKISGFQMYERLRVASTLSERRPQYSGSPPSASAMSAPCTTQIASDAFTARRA